MKLNETISLLSALSDGTRLRLLAVLSEGSLAVSELASSLNLSQPRVSHHLAILLRTRLVRVRREGVRAYYARESRAAPTPITTAVLSLLDDDPRIREDRARASRLVSQRKALRREFFATMATTWPENLATWIDLEAYRALVAEMLPRGGTVADLGCGTGWLLPVLCEHASEVIGVDHAPELLARARHRIREAEVDRCEFRLGELEHLPLRDREVEVVFLGLVLQYLPDPPAVLEEAARVCAAGGSLLVVEPLAHRNERARDELGCIWMGFGESEISQWVGAAGFRSLHVETRVPQDGRLGLLALRGERVQQSGVMAGASPQVAGQSV